MINAQLSNIKDWVDLLPLVLSQTGYDEMQTRLQPIAKSLGIHERYQSLENKYNDQVQHIQKLNKLLSEYKNAVDKTNCL